MFLGFPLLGQHSPEGFEHETTGGVHVQRVEEAGLRRGLPLALPVHRLKQLRQRHQPQGAESSRRYHQNRHTQPHLWLKQVCVHFQNSQYSSIPIDFYWWNIWFCTCSIPICSFIVIYLFLFLFRGQHWLHGKRRSHSSE